jgi:hypothetical protein
MTCLVLSDVQGWALLLLWSNITTLTDTDSASSDNNTTPTAPVAIDVTLSSIPEHDVEDVFICGQELQTEVGGKNVTFTLEEFEVTIMI